MNKEKKTTFFKHLTAVAWKDLWRILREDRVRIMLVDKSFYLLLTTRGIFNF
jgi:hypothetical protein